MCVLIFLKVGLWFFFFESWEPTHLLPAEFSHSRVALPSWVTPTLAVYSRTWKISRVHCCALVSVSSACAANAIPLPTVYPAPTHISSWPVPLQVLVVEVPISKRGEHLPDSHHWLAWYSWTLMVSSPSDSHHNQHGAARYWWLPPLTASLWMKIGPRPIFFSSDLFFLMGIECIVSYSASLFWQTTQSGI